MATVAQDLRVRRELSKAAGIRVSRRKLPVPLHPRGATLAYKRELNALIRTVERLVKELLIPELPSIVLEAELERGGVRVDTSVDVITRIFANMRLVLGAGVTDSRIEEFLAGLAGTINVFSRRETQRQFKAVLGVELIQAEQALGPALEAFVRENVAHVKSIPVDLLDDLEELVIRGVRSGARVEDIAKDISARFGVSKIRATLIARDQVSKLNGELTRQRHENVGIKEYIWDTSQDERVRPGHAALQGTRQKYSKPPIVDSRTGRRANPGQDFQCRCNALPVFPEELLDAANLSG